MNDEVTSVIPMSDLPTFREWAAATIVKYREIHVGSTVGERFHHRSWLPEIVLAFIAADVIRPERRLTQREIDEGGRL